MPEFLRKNHKTITQGHLTEGVDRSVLLGRGLRCRLQADGGGPSGPPPPGGGQVRPQRVSRRQEVSAQVREQADLGTPAADSR